ncbi:hypothetical protein M413DRAFT_8971 [Hebeloma cylindrosporum]|uniref:Uncharacterized protein n=1 Tax=Hebeloma cylindrosporum TaxID=76867 RepID=A0A0C2YUG7_HEBCY|nr:hypothetical protein M413DRAFT_8971 [Hebeloma cylindrosporum h7]
MGHQDQCIEQCRVTDDNPQSKPADPPSVDELESEDGNVPMQSPFFQDSNHPPPPRQSSSPSNNPPHNFPPNNYFSSRPKIVKPAFIHDSSPRQTIGGASPTSNVNENSFNSVTINHHHHYHPPSGNMACTPIPEQDDIHDDDASINAGQKQEFHPSPSPPLSYSSSPLPSTSTTHHVPNGLSTISSLHNRQGDYIADHSSINNTRVPEVDAPSVITVSSAECSPGTSSLHPLLRSSLLGVGSEIRSADEPKPRSTRRAVIQLKHTIKSSLKSGTQSILSSKAFSSIASPSKAPEPLQIVKRVPVVLLRGEKRRFPKNVDVYMHTELDPEPGLEPLHPLRDPNMTYRRSLDDSLDAVYGVNVYDVGYFDGGGRFKLLFNLQMTQEENENLLKFQFKTTSFLPLTGGDVSCVSLNRDNFQVWHDKKIAPDRLKYNRPDKSSDTLFFCDFPNDLRKISRQPLEYLCRFKVRSRITHGTAIAIMGQLKQYMDAMDVPITQQDYFEVQSIEWYRHAKGERNPNIENGDLVLITHCYKAPSWGYINYQFDSGELETTRDTWAAFQPGNHLNIKLREMTQQQDLPISVLASEATRSIATARLGNPCADN